jgi:hypothetical protein
VPGLKCEDLYIHSPSGALSTGRVLGFSLDVQFEIMNVINGVPTKSESQGILQE